MSAHAIAPSAVTINMVVGEWDNWWRLSCSRSATVGAVDRAFLGMIRTWVRFQPDSVVCLPSEVNQLELRMLMAYEEHPRRQAYRLMMSDPG